jgi:hypothetical protein
MSADDAALKKLEESLIKHREQQKKGSKRRATQERYLGHHSHRGLILLTIILLLIIGALILFHLSVVGELNERHATTLQELAWAEAEAAKYKEAYEIVLEDARAYSDFYKVNYTGTTAIAEEKKPTIVEETLEIASTSIWQERLSTGVVVDECIKTTKLIHHLGERVEVELLLSGKQGEEWPELQIFLDGTLLTRFTIDTEEPARYQFAVALSPGVHHLDFVYANGNRAEEVTIHELRIGDRVLETKLEIIDEGALLGMFDCKDTHKGNSMDTIGAYRLRLEKQ